MRTLLTLVILLTLGQFAQAKTAPKAAPKAMSKAAKMQAEAKFKKSMKGFGKQRYTSRPTVVKIFDTVAFNKMPLKNRKAYLTAIADFLYATEGKEKVSYNIFDLIFPHADAATRAYYRNGGFVLTPAQLAALGGKDENFDTRSLLGGFASACDASKPYPGFIPCYPGLGLNESNQAYCVANDNHQLKNCQEAAGQGGINRLTAFIAANPNNLELKQSLGAQQTNINTMCPATTTTGYCGRLNTSLNSVRPQTTTFLQDANIMPTPAALTPENIGSSPLPQDLGGTCSEATKQSLEGIAGPGNHMNTRWLQALNLSKAACPGNSDTNYHNLFTRYGTCFSKNAGAAPDALLAGAMARTSGGNFNMNNDEQRAFNKYFGLTVAQYKDAFCNSANTPANFKDKLATFNTAYGLQSNGTLLVHADSLRRGLESIKDESAQRNKQALIRALNGLSTVQLDTDRSRNDTLRAQAEIMSHYLSGQGSFTDIQAIPTPDIQAIFDKVSSGSDPSIAATWDEKSATASNLARNNTDPGLLKNDFKAANSAFSDLKACADGNSSASNPGSASNPAYMTSYAQSCDAEAPQPTLLVGRTNVDDLAAHPVILVDNAGKCFVFKGADPATGMAQYTNPVTGDTDNKSLEEIQKAGWSVREYKCRDTFNKTPIDGAPASNPTPSGDGMNAPVINI